MEDETLIKTVDGLTTHIRIGNRFMSKISRNSIRIEITTPLTQCRRRFSYLLMPPVTRCSRPNCSLIVHCCRSADGNPGSRLRPRLVAIAARPGSDWGELRDGLPMDSVTYARLVKSPRRLYGNAVWTRFSDITAAPMKCSRITRRVDDGRRERVIDKTRARLRAGGARNVTRTSGPRTELFRDVMAQSDRPLRRSPRLRARLRRPTCRRRSRA